MRRLFPILATIAGLSLVAGLIASGEVPGPLQLLEFILIVWTHAIASVYLESSAQRVVTLAISNDLPDWVRTQTEKNWRKVSVYLWLGLPLFPMVTLAHAKGMVGGAWLIGLLAFNLAFQVGAFVGEYVVMAAQARLVRDSEDWVKSPDTILDNISI
jgi:hypothetical protein